MKERDPFVLLGLPKTATDVDIRRRYRELARKYHPDHNAQDPVLLARFQDISWAYQQIGNVKKRQKYLDTVQEKIAAQTSKGSQFKTFFKPDESSDTLPRKGADIGIELQISFQESFTGTVKEVMVRSEQMCSVCGGSGAAPGSVPYPCQVCVGRGETNVGRLTRTCVTCSGAGIIIEHPCKNCYEGHVVVEKMHTIVVPAGSYNGYEIRIANAGSVGWDETGDVVIRIRVSPSEVFQILPEPGAVQIEVPVNYTEAVLGEMIKVPTPDPARRSIKINVEKGTVSGKKLRVPGQGMPIVGENKRGHLYVILQIYTPQALELNEEQRKHMNILKAYEDDSVRKTLHEKASKDFS